MKVAYITAGAAGMYCGSCLHDNTLAAAMIRLGHEVALVPTYTPIRTDEDSVSIERIFYGGVNVYLQEKFSFFRKTPWLFDKLLNSPALLKWVSRLSSSTAAKDLGALTVSILKGEEGHQHKELQKLVKWLYHDYKPELVQLTNSMFLGMAREIKKQLQVPVLCALQGEDLFLDALVEPYKSEARVLLRERAYDVDGFIATSGYYADYMTGYLGIESSKMHTVRLGIKVEGHFNGKISKKPAPFTIGYLARICPEKGLHILVDAFKRLSDEVGRDKIRLSIAGYLGKKDAPYFQEIQNRLMKWGLNKNCEYVGEVDRDGKIRFLNSIDVLSVPTVYRESKGLFVLEALANGVPVVQPRHGSFPEMIESTGGGILVDPESPEDLARGILFFIKDSDSVKRLGSRGREIVRSKFTDAVMAQATVDVYREYV